MSLIEDIRSIPIFADLEDAQVARLAELASIVELAPGEVHLREGEPATVMFAVVEGEIRSKREKGTPDGKIYVVKPGQISGMLPHSRMKHFPITSRAAVPTRLVCFSTEAFPEMLSTIPILESRLASVMADRVRQTTELEQFRERLMSLGKLSAGLAHELNNPAAAIQRSVNELDRRVEGLSSLSRDVLEQLGGPGSMEGWVALGNAQHGSSGGVDPLERSAREEALGDWLAQRNLPESWLAAETFAAAGIQVHELEDALEADPGIPGALQSAALRWLDAHLAARQLVTEIAEASSRISGIVAAVKSYSHMDRAQAKSELDVTRGLDDTLTVMAHKLRDNALVLRRDYASPLPAVVGNAGELNQVWTNLVDNAIDASPSGAEIVIRTTSTDEDVVVQIIDGGEGIPDEIRQRMFEPFFTTKDVGKGTGLGLDLVQRVVLEHRGHIRVDSSPGRTCFEVRLPRA